MPQDKDKGKKKQAQKQEPIVVSSPNDHRLKAYNDSLTLHNASQKGLDIFNNTKYASSYSRRDSKEEKDAFKRLNAPEPIDYKSKWLPMGEKTTMEGLIGIKLYKQPLQPVVYQKPQQDIIPIRVPLPKAQAKINIETPQQIIISEPQGQYLYGPANSVIGIYDQEGNVSPYNREDQRGKVNKADLEMLNNQEAMKKYIKGKGLKMKKGAYGLSLEGDPISPQPDPRFKVNQQQLLDLWGNPVPISGAAQPAPTYASMMPKAPSIPDVGENPAWINYGPLGKASVPPVNPVPNTLPTNPDYIPNKGEGQLNKGKTPNLTEGQAKQDPQAIPPKKTNKLEMPDGAKSGGFAGSAILAGLEIYSALMPPEKIRRRYVRPEDMQSYNPNMYGTGSQAINKDGGKLKGKAKKAFWGALIGEAVQQAKKVSQGLRQNIGEAVAPILNIANNNAAEADRLNSLYVSGGVQDMSKLQPIQQIAPQYPQYPQYMKKGGEMSYGQGGELVTGEGGKTELKSYNHFDGGTFQFNGDSHGKGGIDINYKGQPAEVEGGETAFKDAQGDLKIMGNLKVPGTNMKYKAMSKLLSKKEEKAQKFIDKGVLLVNTANPDDPWEKLSFNSGKAMMTGGLQKQKQIAFLKEHLGNMQEAHLETAKEKGKSPDDVFDRGGTAKKDDPKPKKWTYKGTNVSKLDDKIKGFADLLASKGIEGYSGELGGYRNSKTKSGRPSRHSKNQALDIIPVAGSDAYQKILKDPELVSYLMTNNLTAINEYDPNVASKTGATAGHLHIGRDKGTAISDQFRNDVAALYPDKYKPTGIKYKDPKLTSFPGDAQTENVPGWRNKPYTVPPFDYTPGVKPIDTVQGGSPISLKQPAPYNKPSNARGLSPLQLLGEGLALTDKVEPVKAQQYFPDLFQPYQVSFQDRLNENQATFNGIQKQLAYDPTALSTLAGQEYAADSNVLADEFRTNQGIANDITNKNVSLLNEAKKTNLSILDTQFVRQDQAKSKTRARKEDALISISSKMLQKEASNNALRVYENLYPDYAFNKQSGKAQYYGPSAEENIDWSGLMPVTGGGADRTKVETKKGDVKTTQYYDDSVDKFTKQLKLEAAQLNRFKPTVIKLWNTQK